MHVIIIAFVIFMAIIIFQFIYEMNDVDDCSTCTSESFTTINRNQSPETSENVTSLQSTQGTSAASFPTDVDGYIHFLNLTGKPITVWLDSLAPCLPTELGGPQAGQCDWNNTNSSSYVVNTDGTKTQIKTSNKNDLDPGQILGIEVPRDSMGKYYWCSDQKQSDGSVRRVCVGTGAWVTEKGVTMQYPDKVMRTEYNWNTNADWQNISYNLSGVDGINAGMIMEYTGPKCNNAVTQCVIDINTRSPESPNGCPWQDLDNGSYSCGSTKYHCSGEGCNLAGCGYSDPVTMLECRK